MLGCAKPKHPLITILDLAEANMSAEVIDTSVVFSFYSITLKTCGADSLKYGRGRYDFEEGTLIALSPGQVVGMEKPREGDNLEGMALYFHPDLLQRSNLQKKIKDYGFFSYDIREALHLSDQERANITSILKSIESEYRQNIDNFSQKILVANIELLLSYVDRYFNRQFITRSNQNTEVITAFERVLDEYFDSNLSLDKGLPSVGYMADKLHMSANYLGDLLKKETGRSAQEHIHDYIIDKATYMLLNSSTNISQISYQLGFEYPQYFSRIFKKKTGLSPAEYRRLH